MAFKSAQASRVLVDHLHASGYTRNLSTNDTTDMLDVTTIADTAMAFIPGQNASTFSLDMLLDALADQPAL